MDDDEFGIQLEYGLDKCDQRLVDPPGNVFASTATLSADPRLCPSLFFQDEKYFSMVSLLGHKPTVVMPIRQKEVVYEDLRDKYGQSLPGTPSDLHTTFRYIFTQLLDYELAKVVKRREQARANKKAQGKIHTAYEMMAVEVVPVDGE